MKDSLDGLLVRSSEKYTLSLIRYEKYGLFLLRASHDRELFIGDNPVIFENISKISAAAPWMNAVDQGSSSKFTMPISPQLALGVMSKGANDQLQANVKHIRDLVAWQETNEDAHVRKKSRETLLRYKKLAKVEKGLSSIRDGRPILMGKSETDLFNKSQALNSFEQIVSKSNKVQNLRHYLKGRQHPERILSDIVENLKR